MKHLDLIRESAESRKDNDALASKAGDSFEVKIDDAKKVSALKEAIKKIKMYQFPAKELQLFLAKKKDGKWLLEESDAAQKLEGGESVPEVMEMIDKNKMLPSWTIEETLDDFKMTGELAPSSKQVHVLVVVPVETESRPTKRQKIDLEAAHSLPHYLPEIHWSDAEQRTRLQVQDGDQLISMPASCVKGTGVEARRSPFVLFRRKELIDE